MDPALVRDTTLAILKTLDGLAQKLITDKAAKIGADTATQRDFAAVVALAPGPRDLMVNTSPEVIAALGVDARSYPVAAFLGGLGTWAAGIYLGIDRLTKLEEERIRGELRAERFNAEAARRAAEAAA